jgi:hypothetical protein
VLRVVIWRKRDGLPSDRQAEPSTSINVYPGTVPREAPFSSKATIFAAACPCGRSSQYAPFLTSDSARTVPCLDSARIELDAIRRGRIARPEDELGTVRFARERDHLFVDLEVEPRREAAHDDRAVAGAAEAPVAAFDEEPDGVRPLARAEATQALALCALSSPKTPRIFDAGGCAGFSRQRSSQGRTGTDHQVP